MIYKGSYTKDDIYGIATPIGVIFATGGLIYGGISIPFWVSSKKRKKERDRLIKMYDKNLLE